jgi:anthranilate 1,2-dioxygenase (deaminating, decarboxylating) small subunit
MNPNHQHSVEQFLYRKAELCDSQAWDDYLALFDEQSEFHVPQWDSEHSYTTDPRRGMSLIYYANRSGLEDRVFRLRTGRSAASTRCRGRCIRSATCASARWRAGSSR